MIRKVRKKKVSVKAYELGAGTEMEEEMIRAGKIIRHEDNTYEIFSHETGSGEGERAKKGDFFKIDKGKPYPNTREFFLANHRKKENGEADEYIQKAGVLTAWTLTEEEENHFKRFSCFSCKEIQSLIKTGRLHIDSESDQKYFSADLFGTEESAAKDAVIVFYGEGDFNFVERETFEQTYEIVNP